MALIACGGLAGCITIDDHVQAYPQGSQVSVEYARKQATGTFVQVAGTVTVPSGALLSFMRDDGFVIQNGTYGIFVATKEDIGLSIGDSVVVHGIVEEIHKSKVIRAARIGYTPAVPPVKVETSWEPTGNIGPEDGGRLVQVIGMVTKPVSKDDFEGWKLYLNDGSGSVLVFFPASGSVYPDEMSFINKGDWVEVTGFSTSYEGVPEIIPRTPEDIQKSEPQLVE